MKRAQKVDHTNAEKHTYCSCGRIARWERANVLLCDKCKKKKILRPASGGQEGVI